MKFLDTNVIVRYLTGDDPRKARQCAQLFERVQGGREAVYTTAMAVAEVVWVLGTRYGHPKANIVEGLRRVLNTSQILFEERETLLMAVDLFERHAIDFIDAYHGAVMLARGTSDIYSYDTDFDHVAGLRRLEP